MLASSPAPVQEKTFANLAIREILALLRVIPEASPFYTHLSKFAYQLQKRKIATATPGVMAEYVMTLLRTLGNFADKPSFKAEATALVTACRKAETAYKELVEKTNDARSRVQWEKAKTSQSRSDPTKNPLRTRGGFGALCNDEDDTDSSDDDQGGSETPEPKKRESFSPRAPTKAKVATTPRALMKTPSTPGAPMKSFDWGDSDEE